MDSSADDSFPMVRHAARRRYQRPVKQRTVVDMKEKTEKPKSVSDDDDEESFTFKHGKDNAFDRLLGNGNQGVSKPSAARTPFSPLENTPELSSSGNGTGTESATGGDSVGLFTSLKDECDVEAAEEAALKTNKKKPLPTGGGQRRSKSDKRSKPVMRDRLFSDQTLEAASTGPRLHRSKSPKSRSSNDDGTLFHSALEDAVVKGVARVSLVDESPPNANAVSGAGMTSTPMRGGGSGGGGEGAVPLPPPLLLPSPMIAIEEVGEEVEPSKSDEREESKDMFSSSDDKSDDVVVVPRGGKGWRRTMFAAAAVAAAREDDEDEDREDAKAIQGVPNRRTLVLALERVDKPARKKMSCKFSTGLHMTPRRTSRLSFAPTAASHHPVVIRFATPGALEKLEDKEETTAELSTEDKILQRCSKSEIVPFDQLFPEEILRNSKKIGEGSYGEVFLLPDSYVSSRGDTASPSSVLKIVPVDGDALVNGDAQTRLDDMLAEITVSTELSRLAESGRAPNYVQVVDCFLTRGHYPPLLLDLWDAYDEEKGSENDRPDGKLLPENQLFIAIVFANGGRDLEMVELTNASKAVSVFQQVAHALAVAESELSFEHRDLHWGNILIKDTEEKSVSCFIADEVGETTTRELKTCGVLATIIDFSLSRLSAPGDIEDRRNIFNDLSKDPALFKAKGDYQFDIYRMMKKEVRNEWQGFHPKTNVFWLHYLLDKLLDGVPYKVTKSQVHRKGMAKLRDLKAKILEYASALEFVREHPPA